MSAIESRFVEWLAVRNAETLDAVTARYRASLAQFRGEHGGQSFRDYCSLSYAIYAPFFPDVPGRLQTAYDFFGHMHFLRMLSYPEPSEQAVAGILGHLRLKDKTRLLDYGCGLAQLSKTVARSLARTQRNVELHLVDYPTCRRDFLQWDALAEPYKTVFADACEEAPTRVAGPFDIVIATEVMEHVFRPVEFLTYFDSELIPGGVLVANLNDHQAEYMHVTPILAEGRKFLYSRRYMNVGRDLWVKPL